MCLLEITKAYNPPLPDEGVAYKLMRPLVGDDRGVLGFYHNDDYWLGKWYRAKEVSNNRFLGTAENGQIVSPCTTLFGTTLGTEPVKYPLGFHCYVSEKDARAERYSSEHLIVRVCYRNAVALGVDMSGYEVVVAQEVLFEEILPD